MYFQIYILCGHQVNSGNIFIIALTNNENNIILSIIINKLNEEKNET